MSIYDDSFACTECDTLDDIASTPNNDGMYICHQCRHGYWHGNYSKVKYDESVHGQVINRGYGSIRVSFS